MQTRKLDYPLQVTSIPGISLPLSPFSTVMVTICSTFATLIFPTLLHPYTLQFLLC